MERLDKAQWELGDLALEVEPIGRDGVNNGSAERLRRYAEEVGVEFEALRRYRHTAHNWSPETRVAGVPWSVHRELEAEPQRKRILQGLVTKADKQGVRLTVDFARRERGKVPTRRNDPGERAEQVREALSDPEVVEQVARDPEARKAVTNARHRALEVQGEEEKAKRREWDTSVRAGDVLDDVPTPRDSRDAERSATSAAFERMYDAALVLSVRLREQGLEEISEKEAREYMVFLDTIGQVTVAFREAVTERLAELNTAEVQ